MLPVLCPVYQSCGGCPLIHLPQTDQSARKRERVLRAFEGAGVGLPDKVPFFETSTPTGYRRRLRLRVEDGHVRFFNDNKDGACVVLEPSLREKIQELKTLSEREPILFEGVSHLEVRGADLDGRTGVFLSMKEHGSAARLRASLEADWTVADTLQPELTWPRQRFALTGDLFAFVPLGSFIQVNAFMNRILIERVVSGAVNANAREFMDLYAGSGNFAIPLLAAGLAGIAVERDKRAIDALVASCAAQCLKIELATAIPTFEFLANVEHGGVPDLVVADPPRAGLGKSAHAIAAVAPDHVALVSCNPESLAKDAAVLRGFGYSVRFAELFDMFPLTEHVEALLWLTRGDSVTPQASVSAEPSSGKTFLM